jgi:hypothetical protein
MLYSYVGRNFLLLKQLNLIVKRMLISQWFFPVTLGLFFLEAVWMAISGIYPMPFDESLHFGLIQLYSHKLLPFWTTQPPGPAIFGAVARDPSYMYHYLFGFIYRVIGVFAKTSEAQIITLRFINIVLLMSGLMVWRLVLIGTGTRRRLVNVVMLLLVLSPVMPFLGAQINYDNLLFPVIGICLLLAQHLTVFTASEKHRQIYLGLFLVIVCIFGSLVKFTFLPILLALFLYFAITVFRYTRKAGLGEAWKPAVARTRDAWRHNRVVLAFLSIVALVLFGLFLQRYGVNLVRYGTPTPQCSQVLGIEKCLADPSWDRNYQLYLQKQAGHVKAQNHDPISFTLKYWAKNYSDQLFFVSSGVASHYVTGEPLRVTRILSAGAIGVGIALFCLWQGDLRRKYRLVMLLAVMVTYLVTLWGQNYEDFVHLGSEVAIQGRYLVPILPILYLCIALGFNQLLEHRTSWKPAFLAVILIVLVTQGGGTGVYVLRSNPSWYWGNKVIIRMNSDARALLAPAAIGH